MRKGSQRQQTAFTRRLALTLVAIVSAVLAASPAAAGQRDVVSAPIPEPGFTRWQSPASGKCLDASDWGWGWDVIQWQCHSEPRNQYWQAVPLGGGYVGLQNQVSWMCLEGLGAERGWDAVQSDCGWSYSQWWYAHQMGTNEWTFQNAATGKCLDAADHGLGTNVYTYACHFEKNQRWQRRGD